VQVNTGHTTQSLLLLESMASCCQAPSILRMLLLSAGELPFRKRTMDTISMPNKSKKACNLVYCWIPDLEECSCIVHYRSYSIDVITINLRRILSYTLHSSIVAPSLPCVYLKSFML